MVVILLAGVGAGTINTIVGSGTLITFPTLIAFGYPPVVATMSNAIGLVPGGVSGTWGYRRELEGQGKRLRWQLPGSFLGALLTENIQRINAAKNLLTLVVNVVAASAYAIVAHDRISWAAAGLIAVGSLIGGFIGATVGRRLSPIVLKSVIVVLGLVAIWRILAI